MQDFEQVQPRFKVGDTIQCSCDIEMIMISNELAKEGYQSDWLNIKEPAPRRYILTITGVDKNERNTKSKSKDR